MPILGDLSKQDRINAGRDNAAGDIHNSNSNNQTIYINTSGEGSPIAMWMALLAEEIRTNSQIGEFIDTLQMYHEKHSQDGIDGLEAKLKYAGRVSEISLALRKKELFTRLLAKYVMFDSAQQIFSYLLSRVEEDFRSHVSPYMSNKSVGEVDNLFGVYLIGPCATEIKSGVFCLNAAIAAGMVYWLAEQCYIRWHT